MELLEKGLEKGSHMYFYTASQAAKKLLYYPVAAGEFRCNNEYHVERESYNSVLAVYVLDGSLIMVQDNIEWSAQKDELLLVDCYRAHKYYAVENARTLWVHFDGNNSRDWFAQMKGQKGQKIKSNRRTAECIEKIILFMKSNQNEYDISKEIYSLLCTIGKGSEPGPESGSRIQIQRAKDFINANYDRAVSVAEIAGTVHMSASCFSKKFKESTGFSPYDYLLSVRLDRAKELLRRTDDSIEDIAYKTGFNSASNFIYFFGRQAGISPLKFRNIKF